MRIASEDRVLVNPFAFPSETTFYFVLMIFSLSSISIGPSISILRHTYSFKPVFIWVVLALFTLIALPTLTIFFYRREIKRRVRAYDRIRMEEGSKISEVVSSLCKEMGIRTPVVFYVKSDNLGDLLVFGSKGQYYMVIPNIISRFFATFPDIAKTYLLHELSHIKNKDVIQHEVAESIWKSSVTVAFVNILYGSLMSYLFPEFNPDIRGWILLLFFMYLVPAFLIFYLNSLIQRTREIYADLRVIVLQRSNRNLVAALRFVPSTATFFSKLISPFRPSTTKRIKFAKEDVSKRIYEKGLVCSTFSGLSFYGIIFYLFGAPENELIYTLSGIIWLIMTILLFSIVLPPYWIYRSLRVKSHFEFYIEPFVSSFKASLPIFFTVLLLLIFARAPLDMAYLFPMLYFFLLGHKLITIYALSLISLKSSKIKVLLSELFSIGTIYIMILMLLSYLDYVSHLHTTILISLFLIAFFLFVVISDAKYSKCPYCCKKIKEISSRLFKCPYCHHRLNEEFLIFLKDYIL